MSKTASEYGGSYWRIEVTGVAYAQEGSLYVYADDIRVDETGALIAIGHSRKRNAENQPEEIEKILCVIAPGYWVAFYAAAITDGDPICVDED